MSGLPQRLSAILGQERLHRSMLCRELGLDPARVVSVERHPERSGDVARVVTLDLATGAREVEERLIPDGWRL